jgi:hypothetical protein
MVLAFAWVAAEDLLIAELLAVLILAAQWALRRRSS